MPPIFNINQKGGSGSVESEYYMIATKKTNTHTQPQPQPQPQPQQQQQQQHVPEPPAIRSDGWCTDPIRQIHTSRCSESSPQKGFKLKKCPPGNDQIFHQQGTETSPTQQVPCLSGICLFPGGYLNPTLQDNPRRKNPTKARPRPRDLRVRSWSI